MRYETSRVFKPWLRPLGWLVPVVLIPLAAVSQEEVPKSSKTWSEYRAELIEYIPGKLAEYRARIERLRIVTRPDRVLEGYDDNPALYIAITSFYHYIRGRELDVYYEQEGIPDFFPDRDAYYDFLDTMLPAMRDRKFERNRLLEYRIHAIEPVGRDEAEVVMSIESDDIFPFGKIMVYRQTWSYGMRGWYPGKVHTEPATYWERIR